MSYLDQYADFTVQLDRKDIQFFDPDTWVAEECAELREQLAVVWVAGLPGRLNGTGATRPDRIRDTRLARAVLHALWISFEKGWGGERFELKPTAEQREAGRQIDWQAWFEERKAYLVARRTRCATLALATDRRGWGNHVVYSYDAELEQLDRVARMLQVPRLHTE